MAEYEEGKKSRFNAGIALTERIDSLQRAINAARFNPLQINFETNTYNYEVLLSANEGLLKESWAKLSADEKERANNLRTLIKDYLKCFPPMELDKNSSAMKVNRKNFEKLLELLNCYENMNKEFLDVHDLNAPSRDEDDDEADY